MLIDTHAHIYHRKFESDLPDVIARAHEAGVERIVLPAIDVASIHAALELASTYEGVYVMVALHPSETKEATDAQMDEVRALVDEDRVVAIGESGLDYYWDRSFDAAQQRFFQAHIRLAMEADLPLILHTRDKKGREEVFEDVVRLLQEEREAHPEGDRLRGIFHCFGGPSWLAETAREMNFLLGLGGTLTFKNSGVDAIVESVPMEQIVLETDAPYLAPEPHRGRRNEPAYTRHVATKLAAVKGLTLDEVARITTQNAERLFNL